jgi:hypothetical protein
VNSSEEQRQPSRQVRTAVKIIIMSKREERPKPSWEKQEKLCYFLSITNSRPTCNSAIGSTWPIRNPLLGSRRREKLSIYINNTECLLLDLRTAFGEKERVSVSFLKLIFQLRPLLQGKHASNAQLHAIQKVRIQNAAPSSDVACEQTGKSMLQVTSWS